MCPSLLLSAALMTPAAPLPPDAVTGNTGLAPRLLALKADTAGNVRIIGYNQVKMTITNTYFVIENNKQVQKQVEQDIVTSQYFTKTLAEWGGKFATVAGEPLTLSEVISRVKGGATVLASADGKPVGKAWLRAAAPDTIVMVAEGFGHAQLQWGNNVLPSTPSPQLTLMGTDDAGKVVAPCVSTTNASSSAVNYDNVQFGARIAFRGGKRAYYGSQPTDTKIVYKPLAQVKFDAYDRNGKIIPRSEALERLAAGGLVLVAGDNRMPDENYLKGLRDDLMILSGAELVLPLPHIDQTKKKQKKGQPGLNAPAAPIPLIKVLPAVNRGRLIRRNAIAPAQKVEPKAAEKK